MHDSLLLTFAPQRQAVGRRLAGVTTRSEVPGTNQLKDVATYVLFSPSPAQIDRHCIVGSGRVRIAGSFESLSKYQQGLEVLWNLNSKLLTSIPKRTQPDRLVDQRIRCRK